MPLPPRVLVLLTCFLVACAGSPEPASRVTRAGEVFAPASEPKQPSLPPIPASAEGRLRQSLELAYPLSIAQGVHHTCAAMANGRVACWGQGEWGQLGSDVVWSDVPIVVPGLTNVIEVVSGGLGSCARTRDGAVWCWGGVQRPDANDEGIVRRKPDLVAAAVRGVRHLCMADNGDGDRMGFQDASGEIVFAVPDVESGRTLGVLPVDPYGITCARMGVLTASGSGWVFRGVDASKRTLMTPVLPSTLSADERAAVTAIRAPQTTPPGGDGFVFALADGKVVYATQSGDPDLGEALALPGPAASAFALGPLLCGVVGAGGHAGETWCDDVAPIAKPMRDLDFEVDPEEEQAVAFDLARPRTLSPDRPCAIVTASHSLGTQTTWLTYDSAGRIVSEQEADKEDMVAVTRTEYEGGRKSRRTRTSCNRKVVATTRWYYDKAGRLVRMEEASSDDAEAPKTKRWHYDKAGHLGHTEEVGWDWSYYGAVSEKVEHHYDAKGREIRRLLTRRFLDKPEMEVINEQWTVQDDGHSVRVAGPLGFVSFERRDAAGRLVFAASVSSIELEASPSALEASVSSLNLTEQHWLYDSQGREIELRQWSDSSLVEHAVTRTLWDGDYRVLETRSAEFDHGITRYRYDGCPEAPPPNATCQTD